MRPDDLSHSPPTVPQLMRLAQRLEQAWQETLAGAPVPDLTAYLPPAADPLRPLVLRELVRIDLEMRCRRGLPASLESYTKRFPELGTVATLPVELVFCEYRARHRYGDQPTLVAYRDRFPAQFSRLEEMVRADSRSSVPAGEEPHADTSQVGGQASVVAPTVPPAPSAPPSRPSSPLSARKTGDILVPPSSDSASEDGKPGVVPMAGGYRLLQRLGAGALGEVWRAEAPGGIEVAVKRLSRSLDSHDAQYELQSLEHVKRLRHPHLVQIHAFWVHKRRLHVAMELADGSLLDRAKECREQGLTGLPCDELLRYMREAAEAFDFLHAEGIHHRDIKPANILLLKGHVKVADFGLARPMETDKSLVNATFCGTPAFMAPEVWESKFSPHSDQWSLAVTYAELRLGRRVFQNRALQLLMAEIRGGKLDLSPLGKAEQRVLRRALHLDPRQRYPSCSAFVQALDEVFRPPLPRPQPPRRRRLLTAAMALAGLALGGLIASVAARLMAPPPPATVSLEAPPELRVRTGGEGTAELHVVRERFPDAVQLAAEGVPPNVEVWAEPSQGDTVRLGARVGPQARPGRYTIRLHTADGPHAEAEWPLVVLYLPPGFEAVGEETQTDAHGVEYYKRLRRPLPSKEAVEFVLVRQDGSHGQAGAKDLETFYVGRDKITRGQFAAFVATRPKELADPPADRKKLSKWTAPPFRERWEAHADDKPGIPIRDVTAPEAHSFAVWLGGRLPTVKEWDKAAGLHHPGRGKPPYPEGPYKGGWDDTPRPRVAVGLAEPRLVGTSDDDASLYGCRDMAGNGLEWTRDVRGGRQVPLPLVWGQPLDEAVYLRGCPFGDDRPLTFDRMDRNECGSWAYEGATPDIGFRVVLEPNG